MALMALVALVALMTLVDLLLRYVVALLVHHHPWRMGRCQNLGGQRPQDE